VTGTVVIPTQISLSLSAAAFTINVNAGQTANAGVTGGNPGAPVTATVTSTDQQGYVLAEALSPAAGFSAGSATLSGTTISPWSYAGSGSLGGSTYGGTGGFGSPFGTAGAYENVAGDGSLPALAGDQWPLTWQVAAPANQAAGTYTGGVSVLAIAS
jgi:hypothetical protein